MDARSATESETVLRQLMLPADANPFGNVHGAWLMKLADEAAGVTAMRHSGCRVVTMLVESMNFQAPVYVGNLVHVSAQLTWTGRTSMEVAVEIEAENVLSGEVRHTNSALFVFVALDCEGHSTPVPPLAIESTEQQYRWDAAAERRARRLRT